MKHRRITVCFLLIMLMALLSTSAFAVDESEVESAIAASGQDAVAGNLFIWFLCAVSFLKISQKIDSFMTSLGINVGRTGGSMMAEMLIAGRALGGAAKATGGAIAMGIIGFILALESLFGMFISAAFSVNTSIL